MNPKERLAAWVATQLRATYFSAEATQINADWWTDLTGAQPAIDERRPRESTYKVAGPFAGALLSVVSFPGRIDLFLEPAPPPAGAMPTMTIGNANELLDQLLDRLPKLAGRLPTSNRIALAGNMILGVRDKLAAYEELKDLLKSVRVDPTKMQELGYRINWPVKLSGREINRLTSWASARIRISMLGDQPTQFDEQHYVQFDFDVNTMPSIDTRLSPDDTTKLFGQFGDLLRQNMSEGEVLS
jgi:hypothetical protein